MEQYIVINNRILDFDKYKNDFLLLQNIIVTDLKEYFLKPGFKAIKTNSKTLRQQINFYNEDLDLKLVVMMDKKGKITFI